MRWTEKYHFSLDASYTQGGKRKNLYCFKINTCTYLCEIKNSNLAKNISKSLLKLLDAFET